MFLSTKMDPATMGPNRHPLVHGPGGILDMMEKRKYRYQADLVRAMLNHPFYRNRYDNQKSLSIIVSRILRGWANYQWEETIKDVFVMSEILGVLPYGTLDCSFNEKRNLRLVG